MHNPGDGESGLDDLEPEPENGAPTASDQSIVLDVDSSATFTLDGVDPDGDSMTFQMIDYPLFGRVATEDGALIVTYTPEATFIGEDAFSYTVTDGKDTSNIATVTIAVVAESQVPVAFDSAKNGTEDTPLTFSLRAEDPQGDLLSYTLLDQPGHGSIALNGGGPSVTYVPDADFNGADAFTFQVNDGVYDSNIATVTIAVGAVDDPPHASDMNVTTDEDTSISFHLDGSYPDGEAMIFEIVSGPSKGSVVLDGGEALYTPNENLNGSDSFTFSVGDGAVRSAPATVSITIQPVNDVPVAMSDSGAALPGSPAVFALRAHDADGDALTYTIVSNGAHGDAAIEGNASVRYMPEPGFSGTDAFSFVANDGHANSNVATITVRVDPVESDEEPESESGWTVFEQAPGARTFYVDALLGSDSNNGLSEDAPKRTIQATKSTMATGDWMLLRRGTVFNEPIGGWTTSGVSETYKTVIGAYGQGARPEIRAASEIALHITGSNSSIARHVAITDLSIVAPSDPRALRAPGISVTGAFVDLHIEGIYIEGHRSNIVVNGMASARGAGLTIRRNVIAYSIHHEADRFTQGIYVQNTDGILIEENYLHHNGWREGDHRDPLAHNVYLSKSNSPAIVRRNVSIHAANTGLMIRCGGDVSENVVAYCPSGIVAGTAKSDRYSYEVPVYVRNNAVLHGMNFGSTVEQWGISAINLGSSEITGNILAHSETGDGYGISLDSDDVFRDVLVAENVVYNHGRGLVIIGDLHDSVRLSSNSIMTFDDYFVDFRGEDLSNGVPSGFSFTGNAYESTTEFGFHSLWDNGSFHQRWMTGAEWSNEAEPDAVFGVLDFADSARDLTNYHASLGLDATAEAFFAGFMSQAKGDWHGEYEARSILSYLRVGYAPFSEEPPAETPDDEEEDLELFRPHDDEEGPAPLVTAAVTMGAFPEAFGVLPEGGATMSDGERALDLLYVFVSDPVVWFDGQLSVDDAGNGIPDIVDAAWRLADASALAEGESFGYLTTLSLLAQSMDILGYDLAADELDEHTQNVWTNLSELTGTGPADDELMARSRMANRFDDERYLDGFSVDLDTQPDLSGTGVWRYYELALRDAAIAHWAYLDRANDIAALADSGVEIGAADAAAMVRHLMVSGYVTAQTPELSDGYFALVERLLPE